jgi:ABC-type lipoprotein export system ATPase subunit
LCFKNTGDREECLRGGRGVMNIKVLKKYKSIMPVEFSLPDFCVLTGKNGSGKSHLLEAFSNKEYATITNNSIIFKNIKYIPFNGLNPQIQPDCQYINLIQQPKQSWQLVKQYYDSYLQNKKQNPRSAFINSIRDEKQRRTISRILKNLNNDDTQLNEDIFIKYFDYSTQNPHELFSSQFATIFKAYHTRMEENDYQKYRNDTFGESKQVFEEDEFQKLYGPKPWDLINKMMENARLPYMVNSPEGQRKESDFHLCLRDPLRNIEIQVNDLSTGEKVLMSLALAIYNSSEEGQKPDLLLLDEPDAALHPEFSKLLIDSIQESIVNRAGVKVIITTHSPTTVAMSNEEYLYCMGKDLKCPVKTTKTDAINILTKGLKNLKISTENRRQIFVEGKYDVEYYEKIFHLLSSQFAIYPCFLAPHNRKGPNCTDVENIVTALTDMGNDLVYGIIDFDDKNQSTDRIKVLGDGTRYAIENYIFDPIFVGILLLDEKIVKMEDMCSSISRYPDLNKVNKDDIQKIINFVELNLNLDSVEKIQCCIQNKMIIDISKTYLDIHGHELEEKIINKWPQLNAIKKGRTEENILKNYVLYNIISDFPEFLSSDFNSLFESIR